MNYRVRVTSKAGQDIIRLAAFLAEVSPHAADRARAAIGEGLLSLRTFPLRGTPGLSEAERELVVPFGSAGYVIQYEVEDEQVIVTRIFHTREDR